jgi:tartrate/fumarate subfamily iron-sulfur-dependent hydro-lyase beta chain
MAVTRITTPLSPDVSRGLRTGDSVLISGRIVTARDQVHKYLASGGESPMDLRGLVIYHCGPVAIQENGIWVVRAAGPTTSMREEPYEAKIIRTHHPGAIMGKGGMGEATREALRTEGCVYLHLTGGAASFIARRIVSVEDVFLTQFGQPEAMWVLQVEELPALVTMDSRGDSLHKKVESNSLKILQQILKTPYS